LLNKAMADADQHENLKDILGFDPNASKDSFRTSVPKVDDERRGWPEDWRERFERGVKGWQEVLFQDPDRLFTVGHNISQIVRSYSRYNHMLGIFQGASTLHRPDNTEAISIINYGDNNTYTWFKMHDSAEFSKKKVGERSVDVSYDPNGNLKAVSFEIRQPTPDNSFAARKAKILGSGKIDKNAQFDFEVAEDEEAKSLVLKRVENGDVKDIIEVPRHVDLKIIRESLVLDELMKNPRNPDPNLDVAWRGVDVFHMSGMRWDPVADDSLHSLTPIPPPAPEDQK
jgi:hypothetical protein